MRQPNPQRLRRPLARTYLGGFFTLTTMLAGAVMTSPSVALAGEAESRTLFAEGRQLRQAGKCADAIPIFRRALETYPEGLGSLRNIAECEEEIGRFASARRDYWDLRLAVLQTTESRYEGWDKDAEVAHKRLEPRVARVTIKVKGPAGAQVYVNGRPLDPRLIGTELEMDLGATEITLRDGTASPQSRSLKLEEGKKYDVELESHAQEGGTAPGPGGTGATPGTGKTPPPGGGDTQDGGGGSGLMIGGIVALSVAGVAAIGFGVSLGVRQGALSDLEAVCPNVDAASCNLTGTARTDAESAKSTGQTASTLVNVFAIGGGVAAAAGISLLVASAMEGGDAGADKASARSAVRVQAVPDFGGGGHLLLQGSF